MKVIPLVEESSRPLKKGELQEAEALTLAKKYGAQISVGFPTPLNNNRFVLKSRGYIGQIPVSSDKLLRIAPKVPVSNVFGMLEYAYKLKSFRILEGIIDTETIDDLFERLASILARRVLDRARKGLLQGYLQETDSLSFVRGRIQIVQTLRNASRGSPQLYCEYEEHTIDLEDNRILAWTLYCLRRLQFKRLSVQREVRQAYLVLAGSITLEQKDAQDCVERFYHRLNKDYEPMHGLCRLFLEHLGPGISAGERLSLPFMLYMPKLFETFVAEWLKENMPSDIAVDPHYGVKLESTVELRFDMDILLRHKSTGKVLAVLDTKYKREMQPNEEDISKVVAYAVQMNAPLAILIYPSTLSHPTRTKVGDIVVQTVVFDINNDDLGGASFLRELDQLLAMS
jgi:5-methylcytosine-specific restriction enzyme subunit McrC